jgi:hypothetical protein
MSQPIDDGGPAFPHGEIVEEMRDEKGKTTGHRVYDAQPGMSLRAWLAGQALQGYLAGRNYNNAPGSYTPEKVARDCCAYADSVIAELKRRD